VSAERGASHTRIVSRANVPRECVEGAGKMYILTVVGVGFELTRLVEAVAVAHIAGFRQPEALDPFSLDGRSLLVAHSGRAYPRLD
jgi:hypothetical protein